MLDTTATPDEALPPEAHYAHEIERGAITYDAAQKAAVTELQRIHDALIDHPPHRFRRGWTRIDGLYLWGSVGRGKTWLMDCFFDSLPIQRKRRFHFHRFMQFVHERRRAHSNRRDPLDKIAAELSQNRVICFDEFFVSDVADAMILGRLTGALFKRGVTLVATSNISPERLYEDGLQRERFLPAIDRIQECCRTLHLDGTEDYRLRALQRAEVYHYPLNEQAEASLETFYNEMTGGAGQHAGTLAINHREIPVRRQTDDVLWCSFQALCEGPRGAADYTEIARCFHTVLLSDVPILTGDGENAARRFITLVDEFYDRGVNLIISAEAPPESIYQGQRLVFEIERTISRLKEMGTQEYLSTEHRP